jgi:hypothetical protein
MSRRWLLSLLCLVLLILAFVQLTRARGELRVDEANTAIYLEQHPAQVVLAVENPSTAINANVQLELLDPSDKIVAKTAQVTAIDRGGQKLTLSLPFNFSTSTTQMRSQIFWYRLHYRITPQDAAAETLANGIISLSEITADLFELRVSTTGIAREGNRYRVRVQAAHPITRRPAANVQLEAQIKLEGNDENNVVKFSGSRVTDEKGRATWDFVLPSRYPHFPHHIRPAGGEIQVTGKRGSLTVQATGDVLVDQFTRILISTDKPLYQPGQVMHVRALVLTPSRQALSNYATYFKITDADDAVLYHTVANTSRFGIASADWTIPENTRLGDYRIWVGVDGGDDQTAQDVRISRYELPNFKVNVDLDRSFYLPDQNAKVTVRADYLFGQSVRRGQVRVVREVGRHWNYREQKWEVDQDEEQKGETKADGSFVAYLDLASDHEDLADSRWDRFKDITYAAYFTDPTTNRTEQRRFDVRLTKDAIHVYVLRVYDWSYSRDLPINFYVTTFYADGSPAPSRVNVEFTDDAEAPRTTKHVATVTTNRYGLAKITTRLPKEFERTNQMNIVVSATDSSGRKGSDTEELRVEDDPRVIVETEKTIYRPGEPINAVITSTSEAESLVVDLAAESGLIRSERVSLRGGRALISFPYRAEFKSRVTVVAYPDGPKSNSVVGIRTVLYPYNSELNVNVRSRDTYRPGEDARLNFSVRSGSGRAEESALGVVVFDQAVTERLRTEQEFGGNFYRPDNGIAQFLGLDDQLAGVTMRDLQRLNTAQPIAPELDLLASVLLRNSSNNMPQFHSSDEFEDDAYRVFGESLKKQLATVKGVLFDHYLRTLKYPADEQELIRSLSQLNIDFNSVRDPWGMPYHAQFAIAREFDVVTLHSSGADKRYGTADDFPIDQINWPYFRAPGEKLARAITRYHERTRNFIRDYATLRQELLPDGFDLDQLKDRWGQPYRLDFTVEANQFALTIWTSGPNKRFAPKDLYDGDDFAIWKSTVDYFTEPRAQISAALNEHLAQTKTFPQSDEELSKALRGLGNAYENLRDPWGNPYYHTFKVISIFIDKVQFEQQSKLGETPSLRTNVTPVTQTLGFVFIRSAGADGNQGSPDDFGVADFSGVISEEPRDNGTRIVRTSGIVISDNNGAIAGVLTDPMGAVIPNATVWATNTRADKNYQTKTDENGKYSFPSLPPGSYDVTFDAMGFARAVISEVLVRSHQIIEVNATMNPGAVTETVTITSAASIVETSMNASMVRTITKKVTIPSAVSKAASQQMSTPRLREYFPETLLWQPSVETDKRGRATVSVKLADNITTWKMLVIGSTEDGRVGSTEKEIRAFQPFFVEHDPPRVLTEGDQLSLPVVVRNYLPRPQNVNLEIKPESWFSLLGPAQKQTRVVAGDAARQTFDFRVTTPVKDGKQRITARASDHHDAIEKPVTVHPDGQELSVTAGDVLDSGSGLELEIAPDMIPNSKRGELKIYPNLLTHVIEGVEAIMQRPYGCGEQTISSTYPSLLLLRHYKKKGEAFPLSARAQRYLSDGYSRLLNYRADDGGITYWGSGEPDVALTAYALQFFVDAREVMSVDQELLNHTREWLVKQQQPNGSWRSKWWTDPQAPRRSIVLTAYIARVLARTESGVSEPLKRGLDFLAAAAQSIDEPYLLASYALAAYDAKDLERARPAVEKLRKLAIKEGNTTYWALETNTPFYGWGLAGRIETTALVVQALARDCQAKGQGCAGDKQLINTGLLFLLKKKDRYGVWQSTQATVNVLDAMLLLFSSGRNNFATQSYADVFINGARVQTLQTDDRLQNPLMIDISQFLTVGKNLIEIKRPPGLPMASVQAVASYYMPWTDAKPVSSKSDLRLAVKFDKTEAKINDEITCRVEAARVGFQGWGMMLAEIGIPPGAEVDRSSLQLAMTSSGINQYDVLPDRVVVYLWPRAGGVSFDFKFRPRFGLTAKSAASTLYDYYNPEATVVVQPSVFRVR